MCVFLDIQEKPDGPESLVFLSNPDYYLSYIDIKTVLKLIFLIFLFLNRNMQLLCNKMFIFASY